MEINNFNFVTRAAIITCSSRKGKGEAGKTCWVISMMLWNLQDKCTEKLFYNKSSTLSLSKSQSFRRSWFFHNKIFLDLLFKLFCKYN